LCKLTDTLAVSLCAFLVFRWRRNEVTEAVYFRTLLRAKREYTGACLAVEAFAKEWRERGWRRGGVSVVNRRACSVLPLIVRDACVIKRDGL
jgi:hypothetical protein